ncbi:O-antigen ligase family protein [Dermatophilaceae bacterium Sec6.4]
MLVFFCAVIASFVAAMTRVISSGEITGAEQSILGLLGWMGVLFVAIDGIGSWSRLQVLLRRVSLLVGFEALVGIIQFAAGKSFVDGLHVPGLTWNAPVQITARDGFFRPAGTATHPLEFGLAISVLLPIVLFVAFDPETGGRIRRWFPVSALCLAIPISISRSAIIATAVVLVIIFPIWSRRARYAALAGGCALLGGMYLVLPKFFGAIQGLFVGLSNNASISSRTDSYSMAWEFIVRSPVVGRGLGTFNSDYRILDNQYLGLIIGVGVLGAGIFVALYLVGAWCAWRVSYLAADEPMRNLARSVLASIAASGVSYAFFDGFGFPMFAGISFLLLGIAGLLYREATFPDAALDQRKGRPAARRAHTVMKPSSGPRQRKTENNPPSASTTAASGQKAAVPRPGHIGDLSMTRCRL